MAVQVGASCLEKEHGGKGVLLGGVPGTRRGRVVILGGGVVGRNAATIAIGYLPWLTVGPFLSALAERYPKRTVMVSCDVARAAISSTRATE